MDNASLFLITETAIGALIREVQYAQSRADFASKLDISLKEANESDYCLSVLFDTSFIDQEKFHLLQISSKGAYQNVNQPLPRLQKNKITALNFEAIPNF